MAMQRQVSPIPPGRYWICILGADKQRAFNDWLRDMRGAVVVESTSLNDQVPSTEFVIFRVPEGRSPFLDAWQFGYPNVAAPNVHTIEDAEQAPVEPNPLEQPGFGSGWLPTIDGAGTLLLILALVLLSRR